MKRGLPAIDLPRTEREILEFWKTAKIFEKSNEQRSQQRSFSFYDGPPFANGLPHYGHMLATTLKDSVTRYWNMRGFYVERRFGWDCHGLPVEYEIEKKHNLAGRKDILEMGVKEFNAACRKSVTHYTAEWQKTVSRIGRFVDWGHQYHTMDRDFMETVWWVFSQLHQKGLVYKDRKIVSYSPRITAVVSNFEANQNYKDVQDPSLIVRFALPGRPKHFLLAWTTTPWTLVSNLALTVNPDLTYVEVHSAAEDEVLYLGKDRLDFVFPKKKKAAADYKILRELSGRELASELQVYEPLFPFFKDTANAFQILLADYVGADAGTGVVHNAPAFGEDDFLVCRQHKIDLVDPLDEEAKFTAAAPDFEGQFVKDADKSIIQALRAKGLVYRSETFVHSYPHCERTQDPLIYRAIPTWYVAVEKIKDGMIRNNQQINWVPSHLKEGRMGQWLENARDWAISRNRFWGTPIPVWECSESDQHREIFGSVAELCQRCGLDELKDIHKESIDHLSFACRTCSGTMQRIPEVFDCWFESGSMPYAQKHYPFEGKAAFEQTFPADFIAEGQDQTRGWFYTLAVLSEALFGKPAFKNVVVNGLVLAADGKKMSKRLGNYTPPDHLLEEFGADGVRLYMLNSPIIRGENLKFVNDGVKDTIRSVILPLWNSYSFLSTYAEADHWQPDVCLISSKAPESRNEIDRWIVSRLHTLLEQVHSSMEDYKLYEVIPSLVEFIGDLTNWYIRLSRRRFWTEGETLSQDSEAAYQTLTYVLCEFSKLFAPYAPFISDHLYRSLTEGLAGRAESVHLCDQPASQLDLIDRDLEEQVALTRKVTEMGRSIRAKHKIKTRQVLASLEIVTPSSKMTETLAKSEDLIREELNVKKILYSADESSFVSYQIKPDLKRLGRRLGPKIKDLKEALAVLNNSAPEAARFVGQLNERGETELLGETFELGDFLIERVPLDDRPMVSEGELTLLLDTTLTPELRREGLSRELINRIQKMRKDKDFHVSDRIVVDLYGDVEIEKAILEHKDRICQETLTETLKVSPLPGSQVPTLAFEPLDIETHEVMVRIRQAGTP